MGCFIGSRDEDGAVVDGVGGREVVRQVLVEDGGFSRFRRATQTPFNLILEARP